MHTHTHHNFFSWLFSKTGNKITKQNFPMNTSLFYFLRTEKDKVKKEPPFSSCPSPYSPESKHSFWGRSRGRKGQKIRHFYFLAPKELVLLSSCSWFFRSPACKWMRGGCVCGGLMTLADEGWGAASNIFYTSRKMDFVSQKEQRSCFWVAVIRNWF